jgi:hydroxymethylbilane synthase
VLDPKGWVPAPAQGARVLVCRREDSAVAHALGALDDLRTRTTFRAEAAAAAVQGRLGGIALGALAMPYGSALRVWGMAASPDGARVVRGDVTGRADDPEGAGRALADLLLARGLESLIPAERT